VVSGQGFIVGNIFAIAQNDAAAGQPVEGALVGVWSLPKPNTVVTFAAGARVWWDGANSLCKASFAGYFVIGVATAAAAATDATVSVRLDGTSIVAT
jgi:predicted RecA/RadA family phage recombinase